MKTRNIYSLLYVTFVAVVLVACNDYDAAQTAYEEIVDMDIHLLCTFIRHRQKRLKNTMQQ